MDDMVLCAREKYEMELELEQWRKEESDVVGTGPVAKRRK